MKFLVTGCNYVGTPEGYVQLEKDESIDELFTLSSIQCKWVECKWKDVKDNTELYEVITNDTGFCVCRYPGKNFNIGGELRNCFSLGDCYFNGCWIETGTLASRFATEEIDPYIYDEVWGSGWERDNGRKGAWYKRAWDCRARGIAI